MAAQSAFRRAPDTGRGFSAAVDVTRRELRRRFGLRRAAGAPAESHERKVAGFAAGMLAKHQSARAAGS